MCAISFDRFDDDDGDDDTYIHTYIYIYIYMYTSILCEINSVYKTKQSCRPRQSMPLYAPPRRQQGGQEGLKSSKIEPRGASGCRVSACQVQGRSGGPKD